jgi:hypothetical protein
MPAQTVAQIGTSEGRVLSVVRSGGAVLIADGGTTMPVDDAGLLRDVLLRAADAEIGLDRVRLIGTIGRVHVLKWQYAVSVTDHPDPIVPGGSIHSGFTMRTDQAVELAEALLSAAGDREP